MLHRCSRRRRVSDDFDQIFRIADFLSHEDMDRAIRKLDGTELEGREVRIDEMRRRSGSRRRSPSRSRSRSRKRYRN